MAKKFFEQLVSPKGVLVYPRFNKPDTKYVAEGEFSTKIKLDTQREDVQAYVAKIETLLDRASKWAQEELEERIANAKDGAQKGKLKKALKELKCAGSPVKPVLDEEGEETSFVQINAKLKAKVTDKKTNKTRRQAPVLKDAKRKVLDRESLQVGGGTEAKVVATFYPYFMEKDGEYGLSVRLQVVQILKLVEWTGGDDGLEDEDGYEGEEASEKPAKDEDGLEDESGDESGGDDNEEF